MGRSKPGGTLPVCLSLVLTILSNSVDDGVLD